MYIAPITTEPSGIAKPNRNREMNRRKAYLLHFARQDPVAVVVVVVVVVVVSLLSSSSVVSLIDSGVGEEGLVDILFNIFFPAVFQMLTSIFVFNAALTATAPLILFRVCVFHFSRKAYLSSLFFLF